MRSCQPLPRLWLMTDERLGDRLFDAIDRLPRRSGIVFRHYSLADADRRALFDRVRRVARRRAMVLLLAGSAATAQAWGADGSHGRGRGRRGGLRSAPVHDAAELRAAERAGADLLFLSPVFPTRSHPNVEPLGEPGFARLARMTDLPVIALGGMDAVRGRRLQARGAYGWAAIDAFLD
jgi:thiamine-phosphate pyrophosphorylase